MMELTLKQNRLPLHSRREIERERGRKREGERERERERERSWCASKNNFVILSLIHPSFLPTL
jgi:hypothetical protein